MGKCFNIVDLNASALIGKADSAASTPSSLAADHVAGRVSVPSIATATG